MWLILLSLAMALVLLGLPFAQSRFGERHESKFRTARIVAVGLFLPPFIRLADRESDLTPLILSIGILLTAGLAGERIRKSKRVDGSQARPEQSSEALPKPGSNPTGPTVK